MNGKLILMVGCPGAGKSTWIRNNYPNITPVSRDAIRFELLDERGGNYFDYENEVFASFIHQIIGSLVADEVTIADATHLNKKARQKVLNQVAEYVKEIEVIYFNIPLEVAQERNAKRAGRAYVPPEAVERMYYSLEEPQWKEGKFTYNKIYIIDENGNMEEKK